MHDRAHGQKGPIVHRNRVVNCICMFVYVSTSFRRRLYIHFFFLLRNSEFPASISFNGGWLVVRFSVAAPVPGTRNQVNQFGGPSSLSRITKISLPSLTVWIQFGDRWETGLRPGNSSTGDETELNPVRRCHNPRRQHLRKSCRKTSTGGPGIVPPDNRS